MFRDRASLNVAPFGGAEEVPAFLLPKEDMAKKTDTSESTGRSASLPDLLYKGRDSISMKSSRSKRKPFLEAS